MILISQYNINCNYIITKIVKKIVNLINFLRKILFILDFHHKVKIAKIFSISILSAFLEILSIGLIIPILTIFVNQDYEKYTGYFNFTNNLDSQSLIILVLVAFLIVYILKIIINLNLIFRTNHFKNYLYVDIVSKLLNGYLNRKLNNILEKNSASIIRNLNIECNLFSYAVVISIVTICSELVVFTLISLTLFYFNWKITSIIFIYFFLISIFLYYLNSLDLKKYGSARQKFIALTLKELQQSIGNLKEIFLYNLQSLFLKSFVGKLLITTEAARKRDNIIQSPRQIFELLGVVGVVALATLSIYFFKKELSEILILVGVFIFASIRLMPGIIKILNGMQNLKFNSSVVKLIHEEFIDNIKYLQKKDDNKNSIDQFKFESLSFDKVSFSYDKKNNKEIFKDLSFEIKKGDKIGIMGDSGTGKSTFVSFLCGFFQPDSGEILINKKSLNEIGYNYKNKIGYVPQSIFIADESVEFNIVLTNNTNDIDKKKLSEILEFLDLRKNIFDHREGLQTKMGEDGMKFSGGQLQRIGIARALYRNPELIILDEATNSLDFKTEKKVIKEIFKRYSDKTIIIISHSQEVINYCEKRFFLDNKKLKEIN